MELLFIDESGDNGFADGSTDRFILAGISIRSSRWKEYFWKVIKVKGEVSKRHGIRMDEFKGLHLFEHRGAFFDSRLTTTEYRSIYNNLIDLLCDPYVDLFVSIHFKDYFRRTNPAITDKKLVRTFTEQVWREYLFEYEEFLFRETYLTGQTTNAIIYFDPNGQEKYLRRIVRDFARRFDPNAKYPAAGIVEDIVFRDSKTSYLIQLADVLAYSMHIFSTPGVREHLYVTEDTKKRLIHKIRKINTREWNL